MRRMMAVDGPLVGRYFEVQPETTVFEVLGDDGVGHDYMAWTLTCTQRTLDGHEQSQTWEYLAQRELDLGDLLIVLLRYGCEPAPGWER